MTATITKQLPDRVSEIKGVEIFEAGDYPQGSFTVEQMDEIIASYDVNFREAQITKDHIQGGESFGAIRNLRRIGKKLVCDFVNVAADLVREIRAGKWKTRSIELRREDSGKWYLTACTMLGALQPAVPGMAPIKFADDAKHLCFSAAPLDLKPFTSIEFSAMPTAPEGAQHDVLTRTEHCRENVGHCHEVYLDAQGNGFSGPAWFYDGNYNRVEEIGGHQHVVTSGAILPSGDPSHIHELTLAIVTTTVGEDTRKETAMSDKKEITVVEFNDLTEKATKFAAMSDENAALKTEIETLKATITARDAADEAAKSEAKFNATFDAAAKAGKVEPHEREGLLATFNALPGDAGVVLKFGDKQLQAREHFLASIEARKPVVPMSELSKPGLPVERTDFTDKPGAPRNSSVHFRALEIQKEKQIGYEAAATLAMDEADKASAAKS